MNLHDVTLDQLQTLLPSSIIESFNRYELEEILRFWKRFYKYDETAEFKPELFERWTRANNIAEAYKFFRGEKNLKDFATIVIEYLNANRDKKIDIEKVDFNNLDSDVIDMIDKLIGHCYYQIEIVRDGFKDYNIHSKLYRI